jgi:PBSX family phage terminase large subunit
MPVDEITGVWSPRIFERQAELIRVCRSGESSFILAAGPRYSGKTLGCLHALADHAWQMSSMSLQANIALVAITQSAGYDSGVWTDLIEVTIPEWIAGDFGMEWVKPPAVQHVSKKPYCVIGNKRTGISAKFQLESLKYEEEVEQRFKGKRYSAIFINELSNFRRRKTLDTWSECLRMVNLPMNKHFLLADTNPADEGARSWIYKLWFEFPLLTDSLSEAERALQKKLALVEFTIPDNVFAPPERVDQLKGMLSNNKDLYARYVEGKWVTASIDALFVDVFRENIHVVGEIETRGNPFPTIMLPESTCYELYTGWDLGVVNSAAVILEKTFNALDTYRRPIFKQLDELVITNEDFSMEDFVREFIERMRFWDARVSARKVKWTHYSDRSAFDMKDPVSNRFHHQIVWDASPEDTPGGKIQLIAAARGKNSVQQRIDLFRRLLWENRYFANKNYCPTTIEAIKSIKKGKTTLSPIERGSVHKHPFDALTYPIASECVDELDAQIMESLRPKRDRGGLIAIPM